MSKRKAKDAQQSLLWGFSLAVYGQPEVEQVCLMLQDKLGLDVNLLLACLWVGVSGRGRLGEEELADLEQQVAFWQQEIVEPMRQVRRRLKELARFGGERFVAMRKSVSASELEAEQVEQQMLEQALEHRHQAAELGQAQRLSDTLNNLLILLRRTEGMEPGWLRSMAVLLEACFPSVTREQIMDILRAETSNKSQASS
jgi:uncharacterized protein (TIGR02444 family)